MTPSQMAALETPECNAALSVAKTVTVLLPSDIEDALKKLMVVATSLEQRLAAAVLALEWIETDTHDGRAKVKAREALALLRAK